MRISAVLRAGTGADFGSNKGQYSCASFGNIKGG